MKASRNYKKVKKILYKDKVEINSLTLFENAMEIKNKKHEDFASTFIYCVKSLYYIM